MQAIDLAKKPPESILVPGPVLQAAMIFLVDQKFRLVNAFIGELARAYAAAQQQENSHDSLNQLGHDRNGDSVFDRPVDRTD